MKFDGKDFQYVENLAWIKLDPAKEAGTFPTPLESKAVRTNDKGEVDIRRFYWRGHYPGFAKSKATLLIFRRVSARTRSRKGRRESCS